MKDPIYWLGLPFRFITAIFVSVLLILGALFMRPTSEQFNEAMSDLWTWAVIL